MKQNLLKSLIFKILLAFVSFVYFFGCSNEVTPSLYSEVSAGPIEITPKISSVDPASTAIAGVTTITITGENFLSDTSAVKVYFGKQPGTFLSASPTQLKVISPNVSGVVKIKISTNVAELFSNTYDYYFEAAAN